ncbi:hypothetical protein [Lysinibacillus fusiformis]|uniref:hypothetical protein n=1 Tax=Lysinibacillus fusiformis TaxID=28031 RepID=UPI000468ECDF|nr:hypothetical protein [Lysinibacillus fusiformis]
MPDELKDMANKSLLDNKLSTAQSALAVGAGAVFLYPDGGRKLLSKASGISSRVLGEVSQDFTEIEEPLHLADIPFSTEHTNGNTFKIVEEAIKFAIWYLNKARKGKQGNGEGSIHLLNDLNISTPIRVYKNKMISPMDIVCELNDKEKWKTAFKKETVRWSNKEGAPPTTFNTPFSMAKWEPTQISTDEESIIPLEHIRTNHLDDSLINSKVLVEVENKVIIEKVRNEDNLQQERLKDSSIENSRLINDELTISKRLLSLEEPNTYSDVTNSRDNSSPQLGKLGMLALEEILGENIDVYRRAMFNSQMETLGVIKEDEVRSGLSIIADVKASERNFELRLKMEETRGTQRAITDEYKARTYQKIEEKLKGLQTSEFKVPLDSITNVSTMYGTSRSTSWAELIKAAPQNNFFEEELEKQEETLKYYPSYTKKNIKNTWRQEPIDQELNSSSIGEKHLLIPIWKPENELENVNVKTIQNEGMLLADYGYYESQPVNVSMNHIQNIKSQQFTNSLNIVSSINTILKGMGLVGVDVNVSTSSKMGVEVKANIMNTSSTTQYVEKKIQDLLNF